MNKAGYQQQSQDSAERIEEKMDLLAAELIKLRLTIEKLAVGRFDFHLANLNIHEVSGVLNIGITNGVSFQHAPVEKEQGISKNPTPKKMKEGIFGKTNKSGPDCKIHFT